jgi:hypothetical protein
MNIVKPAFKPLCAKPVKQTNKLKCAKTVFEKVGCKTKNREKFVRQKVPMNVKEFVQERVENRKNLVEICMKKARVMAQRKADRNNKEYYNFMF